MNQIFYRFEEKKPEYDIEIILQPANLKEFHFVKLEKPIGIWKLDHWKFSHENSRLSIKKNDLWAYLKSFNPKNAYSK